MLRLTSFIIIFILLRATHLEGPAARSNIFRVFEHLQGARTCSRCSNKRILFKCSGIAHVQSELRDYCRRPRRCSLDRTPGSCSKTQYGNTYVYIYMYTYIYMYIYIYTLYCRMFDWKANTQHKNAMGYTVFLKQKSNNYIFKN